MSITAIPSLTGTLQEVPTLSGFMTAQGHITGSLSGQLNFTRYTGKYVVTPEKDVEQKLETKDKLLKDDIVVEKIPYWETSNEQDGITVYIGKEAEIYGS